MSGYKNYSMSNNAIAAYENGERPLSKWTKSEILDGIAEIDDEKAEICNKLTLSELKSRFLRYSSWHHTSEYYNCTDFYEIDSNAVDEISAEKIVEIITNRPKKERKSKLEPKNPLYITAIVRYIEWEGTRKHPKAVNKQDIVFYREGDKMIKCPKSQNWQKRLSSLSIVFKVEQKTKYATAEAIQKRYENQNTKR